MANINLSQLNLNKIYQLENKDNDDNEWHIFIKKYILHILSSYGEYTSDIIDKNYDKENLNKTINNLRKVQRKFGLSFDDLYSEGKAKSKAKGLITQMLFCKDLNKNNVNRNVNQIVKENNFVSILDFGGGDGYIVYNMAQLLNIDKNNTYVADIPEWLGQNWKDKINKNVNYVHPDSLSDIHRKFDIIVVSHTLHHIKDDKLYTYIDNFYNLLNPNGIIILKEHNCGTTENKKKYIIDLEHILYDTIVGQQLTYSAFMKKYYSKFRSKSEWDKIFNKFKLIHDYNLPKSKDYSFIKIYRKI